MTNLLPAKAFLERVDRRLKALGLTDNAAGTAAGSRDLLRNIRRQVREGKQHSLSVTTAERLAPALKTTPGWLLYEVGPESADAEDEAFLADTATSDRTVPLVGYVGAGAEAHFYATADEHLDEVPAPEGSSDSTRAVEIRGDSLGSLFDRWLVFYDDVRSPVTPDLIGRLCIVGLEDDRVLVKKIRRAGNGLFDLISDDLRAEPIRGAAIRWAARVKTMMPR